MRGFRSSRRLPGRADPHHVVTASEPVMLCFRSRKEGAPEAPRRPRAVAMVTWRAIQPGSGASGEEPVTVTAGLARRLWL